MYYHIIIETSEKVGKNGNNKQYSELDKTDINDVESRIIIPFLNGESFQFNGYFLQASEIKRLVIRETKDTSENLVDMQYRSMGRGVVVVLRTVDVVQYDTCSNDITQEVLSKARVLINTQKSMSSKDSSAISNPSFDMNKVFIVHGRDELAKTEVARFLENLGCSAIILHEQVNAGKTIIEKIDEHTNVGFGLVLYTPCDVGRFSKDKNLKNRARQNVVFEHGYLLGKLGRDKVCALVKGDVEPPSDISGVVYVPFDDHGAWKMKVVKEMQQLGYEVDMNKAL